MSKTIVYDVLRGHEGDRFYKEGGERELTEADAAHLVKLGVLKATDRKPKAPDVGEAKPADRAKADTAIAAIKAEVTAARSAADSALKAIDNEMTAKQAEIGELEAAIVSKKSELADLDTALVAKRAEIDALPKPVAPAAAADDANKTEPANATKPDTAAKAKG